MPNTPQAFTPVLKSDRNRFWYTFIFLVLIAFLAHFIVLRFFFPHYYSPLYPHHSDFYYPPAFAHDLSGAYAFRRLATWPRPVYLIFDKLIGYFGFNGSVACVIVFVFADCALAALLIKRVLKLEANGPFFVLFFLYCYLLFSQPYFYTFYAQDVGAQLSFFFLLAGSHFYYWMRDKNWILAGLGLLLFCVLAFLSKETYALSAGILTLAWFFYSRKNKPLIKALIPGLVVLVSILILFLYNMTTKSVFTNVKAGGDEPYHIDLGVRSVVKEWLAYARESLNAANILLVLLLGYLFFKDRNKYRNELLFIIAGCVAGALISWLPNAVLPNHHFKGYSFNGNYLLYLPLVAVPILWSGKKGKNFVFAAILLLCLASPFLNRNKYKDPYNSWVLVQETTQRNFLTTVDSLMRTLTPPSDIPSKILIRGLTFPFHPFSHPEAIRAFPNARLAFFDVVDYNNNFPKGTREDLVKFVTLKDGLQPVYRQKWVFNDMGKLVSVEKIPEEKLAGGVQKPAPVPVGDTGKIRIDWENLADYTTTGFYSPENGIRWVSPKATISFDDAFEGKDSLFLVLDTYLPPICKDVNPVLTVTDIHGKEYKPIYSTKKEDRFYYSFVIGQDSIRKINILSQRINSGNDIRALSFPMRSLEVANKK